MEKKYVKPTVKAIVIDEELLVDYSMVEHSSSRVRATDCVGADILTGESVQGDAKGNSDFDW